MRNPGQRAAPSTIEPGAISGSEKWSPYSVRRTERYAMLMNHFCANNHSPLSALKTEGHDSTAWGAVLGTHAENNRPVH
jgi:hypothetical protein